VQPEQARELAALAKEKGLLLCAAPDTFLGAGIQTARAIVDSGIVGDITSCVAVLQRDAGLLAEKFPYTIAQGGGKTLRGPQASGLILGKRRYIEECRRFGAPMHGVCRSAKATKESMIGLYVAVKNFMATDWTVWNAKMDERVERMLSAMRENPLFAPYRVDHGSVGQSYPRAFAHVAQPCTPEDVVHRMREQHIFIGMDKPQNAIYLSPQNLTDEECGMVCEALKAIKGFAAD